MDQEINAQELKQSIAARLKELPKVVRDSITSAEIEKRLRELADTNKLHIDQWQLLEDNVMLTLLGFQEPDDLATNLERDLEVGGEVAATLSEEVSHTVFEPIRAELERELEFVEPRAEEAENDSMGSHTLTQSLPAALPVIPATPPPSPPTEQVVRAPISASYEARQPSHQRKVVEGDPYREQVQ